MRILDFIMSNMESCMRILNERITQDVLGFRKDHPSYSVENGL